MSDKLRAAAKAALYAMESSRVFVTSREQIKQPQGEDWYDNIINDLEAALAEPAIKESLTVAEQEPVAWITKGGKGDLWWSRSVDEDGNNNLDDVPLYTAPPRREWVGLTGPEVDEAYGSVSDKEWAIGGLADARVFFCAIEAKLREKNK